MKQIGQLFEADGRYEFRLDEMSLIVRGDHPEWVLQAAAEVAGQTARLEAESRVEELESLVEFEAATEIEVDSAKFSLNQRFEVIPQCLVTMGRLDYKWAAPAGREHMSDEFGGHPYRRVHNMALTYNDTFLRNEDGVDTSSPE